MNKEQRRRMASREFIGTDPHTGLETSYTVQVSGTLVEIHRKREEEWENANGTGNEITHDRWIMGLDDLKNLVQSANWAMQNSEAFEATHPPQEQYS